MDAGERDLVSRNHPATGWFGAIDGQAVAGCAAMWVGDGAEGWIYDVEGVAIRVL